MAVRRHPARRNSCRAEGTLGQSEQRLRGQERQLVGRRRRPLHALRLPAGEVLGPGEVVEVEDQRQPALGQVARDGRGGRELVDGHVTRRRMLGVHPVLERLGGQVVVDRLGEDLRAPACGAQGVTQLAARVSRWRHAG